MTLAQSNAALEKAQHIRLWRAEIKRMIAAAGPEGAEKVAELLADPPVEIESMRVGDLLQAIYRVGRDRAIRLLNRSGISESRPVGALTDRQRDVLAEALKTNFVVQQPSRSGHRTNGYPTATKLSVSTSIDWDLVERLRTAAEKNNWSVAEELRNLIEETYA